MAVKKCTQPDTNPLSADTFVHPLRRTTSNQYNSSAIFVTRTFCFYQDLHATVPSPSPPPPPRIQAMNTQHMTLSHVPSVFRSLIINSLAAYFDLLMCDTVQSLRVIKPGKASGGYLRDNSLIRQLRKTDLRLSPTPNCTALRERERVAGTKEHPCIYNHSAAQFNNHDECVNYGLVLHEKLE